MVEANSFLSFSVLCLSFYDTAPFQQKSRDTGSQICLHAIRLYLLFQALWVGFNVFPYGGNTTELSLSRCFLCILVSVSVAYWFFRLYFLCSCSYRYWLPIKYRIEFKILLITFKSLNLLAPTYLLSLISLRLPSKYNLRNSSDNLLLSYPRFKSKVTLGDRSFTCAAPKLWNALPFDIRSASTVNFFKAKLKTHLFRHALLL